MEDTEDNRKMTIVNNDKGNLCDFADVEISRHIDPISDAAQLNSVVLNDKDHNVTSSTTAIEMEKNSMHKSHKQSNTMFGTFDPSSISNSVQDTGYQTYSMNSTVHTVDSYSISMQNHKAQSTEQTVTSKNDALLSWKEDMLNVFSSTPSKCKKEKES